MVKNRVININLILLNNYKKLNLDEKEVVVIMHLFFLMQKNKNQNPMTSLKTRTTFKIKEISEILNGLVVKDYLSIDFDSKSKKETYNLAPMLRAIQDLFTEELNEQISSEEKSEIKKISEMLQVEFARSLSPYELEIVSDWISDDETYSTVKKALAEANKAGKVDIKYIDAILVKEHKKKNPVNTESIDAFYEALK